MYEPRSRNISGATTASLSARTICASQRKVLRLAVGDRPVTLKCVERMNRFKEAGRPIVFVSHDLEVVRTWCAEAVWLDQGVLRERGKPGDVVDAYLASLSEGDS